jgi:hypothetical protein
MDTDTVITITLDDINNNINLFKQYDVIERSCLTINITNNIDYDFSYVYKIIKDDANPIELKYSYKNNINKIIENLPENIQKIIIDNKQMLINYLRKNNPTIDFTNKFENINIVIRFFIIDKDYYILYIRTNKLRCI